MVIHPASSSATSETVAARLSHEASTTGSVHSVIRFSTSSEMSKPRERSTLPANVNETPAWQKDY